MNPRSSFPRRAAAGAALLALGLLALPGCRPSQAAAPADALLRCTPQLLSRLYFGLDSPSGPIDDAAWRAFVDSEIATRLPVGFTWLAAHGGWRDEHGGQRREDARVLEVVGDNDAALRAALGEIVARYKQRHQQQDVLVTQQQTRVCR